MATDIEASASHIPAIANMPSDLAILRLENETIQSLAAARPRNHLTIKADIAAQLEAYPSFAKAAIYAKPCGKDPETGRQKIARGLSIRAAEALAEAYGFCRIRTDVTPLDEDTVKVEATFTDYQKGRIWQDGGIVSKWYRGGKNQGYKMVKHADDRFYGVVVKAELSRRVREVITRSVPPGLRAELFEMAEKQLAKLLDDGAVGKIVAKFGQKGVTLAQLETHIGRTKGSGWTEEDRLDLLGLWNAIEDGETTINEAFGDDQPKDKPKPPSANGGASAADLSSPSGTIIDATSTPHDDPLARILPKIEAAETDDDLHSLEDAYLGDGSALSPDIQDVVRANIGAKRAEIRAARTGKATQRELVK